MLFWLAIIVGLAMAAWGHKRGLFVLWQCLFNAGVAIYVAVMLTPRLVGMLPEIGQTPYHHTTAMFGLGLILFVCVADDQRDAAERIRRSSVLGDLRRAWLGPGGIRDGIYGGQFSGLYAVCDAVCRGRGNGVAVSEGPPAGGGQDRRVGLRYGGYLVDAVSRRPGPANNPLVHSGPRRRKFHAPRNHQSNPAQARQTQRERFSAVAEMNRCRLKRVSGCGLIETVSSCRV